MHPIQMQEGNRGIGMGYEQFVGAFESVCHQHLKEGRARAFAFVFYDMTHGTVRDALSHAHGFQRLHDKTGKDVTLFYLHDRAVHAHWQRFNREFMAALGVDGQATTPCMVFFRVEDDAIVDVSIYEIDEESSDPVLTVAELEQYVEAALKGLNAEGDVSALTSVGAAVVKFGSLVKLGEFLLRLKGVI